MDLTIVPILAILTSLVAVPFILLSSDKPNLREFWTIAAAVIKLLLVLTLVPTAVSGETIQLVLWEIAPDLPLLLTADPLGIFFAVIASSLWLLTSFYSIGYMRGHGEVKQTRYFASFAVCLSSTIGIAFSGNLLTFILFYEILTIATYPLVIHSENEEAISAGRKYLTYTLTAGLLLIAAAGITYSITGTLAFEAGGIFPEGSLSIGSATAIFLLFLGGVGVKAGLIPIHSWLPSAMAAPTPVSALLHAVAVVKSGVFGVIRVVGYTFGPETMTQFGLDQILMGMAGATILLASLLAFKQDNLKLRLAYSTVGHLSYIVLGASLLTPVGMTGSILHISAHATMKITLFFCAGAIAVNLHKKYISQLDGIARVMPWTMAAFTVGSLGLAGFPPINGFVSKWFLGYGALQGDMLAPVLLLVTSGLLNVGYFFPIIKRAYFHEGGEELSQHTEAHPFMVVPLTITAAASLAFGLAPNLFVQLFDIASVAANSIF